MLEIVFYRFGGFPVCGEINVNRFVESGVVRARVNVFAVGDSVRSRSSYGKGVVYVRIQTCGGSSRYRHGIFAVESFTVDSLIGGDHISIFLTVFKSGVRIFGARYYRYRLKLHCFAVIKVNYISFRAVDFCPAQVDLTVAGSCGKVDNGIERNACCNGYGFCWSAVNSQTVYRLIGDYIVRPAVSVAETCMDV